VTRAGPARTLAAVVALAALAASAGAEDTKPDKAFLDLKARYEKAAKKHDDEGVRERRKLLVQFYDMRRSKACKKLFRDALDSEDSVDTLVSVVHVLAASGDPKEIDAVVKTVTREKRRGPAIALGEALAYTHPDDVAAVTAHALSLVPKTKGDVRLSLLEGIGELADPSGYDGLVALGDVWLPDEHYLRFAAMGACGRERAVETLAASMPGATGPARRGVVVGLARTGAPASLAPLTEALRDLDPVCVEIAADALGKAKHLPAADALADVLATAPLRARVAARSALVSILGRDHGLDAAAWRAALAGKKPAPPVVPADSPALPSFFGIPVASDRVAVLLDRSHSMAWMGRLARAQEGIVAYLQSLDDATSFAVFACDKDLARSGGRGLAAGPRARADAIAWMRKLLGGGGFDLKSALVEILQTEPDVDTILLATDSLPWGSDGAETCTEALEVFRRANTSRRVRVHVAFVVPGGRVKTSEIEGEFEDREAMLELLAETSGGTFVRIDS
jgi:HEAT repeat protein